MLKALFLFLGFYYVWRAVARLFGVLQTSSRSANRFASKQQNSTSAAIEELLECPVCGIYFPKRKTFAQGLLSYCGTECASKQGATP